MSSFLLRPSFTHTLEMDPESARSFLTSRLEPHLPRCEVKSFPGFLCLRIPPQQRRFWSPRLNLSLEADGTHRTRIIGTYGPNANMWSAFLYAYLFSGSAGLFSGIFGYCQWKLGMTPWGLWIFAAMATVALGLYLMAQFGQKLGARQMFLLHQIYEAASDTEIPVN